MDGDYDYAAAGFDGFLSRSVDNLPRVNLDGQGPQSTAQAFDRTQVTGSLGDTLQIGGIKLNGSEGNIIVNDGNDDRLLLGEQVGGF